MLNVKVIKVDPAYSIDIHYQSVDQSINPVTGLKNYPDFDRPYLVYPIHRFTQIQRYEPSIIHLPGTYGNQPIILDYRRMWKPFENYKLKCGNGAGGITIWDQSVGYPPSAVYSGSPQLPAESCTYYFGGGPFGSGPNPTFGEAGKWNAETTINGRTACPRYYSPNDDGTISVPPVALNSLYAMAMRHMLPGIKEELSALNSLYELKDFKSLPGIAKGLAKAVYKAGLIKSILNTFKGVSNLSLRELSRKSAGGFLSWKFAIAPLISDIRGIHTALNQYKTRIDALVSKTGGRRRKHFTYSWNEHETTVDEISFHGLLVPDTAFRGCVTYQAVRDVVPNPSVFHAEVEYNYNYTQYQLQNAATLALLDALGVNFSPRIIWDALPFSFVVDWVLKVGQSLDQFETKNMEPQVNIGSQLWSIKRSREIRLKVKPSFQITALEGILDRSPVSLPVVKESIYSRRLSYQLTPGLIETSGLSASEFTLGAAIVIAQRKRRKSR